MSKNVCFERYLIRLQFLLLEGIVLTQTLGKSSLASALFTATFLLTLAIWLLGAAKTVTVQNGMVLMILILSCVSVLGNALITGTVVSLSYFRKWLMFCATVLFWGAMGEYRPEWADVRLVFRMNTLLACFLTAMYLLHRQEMYLLNGNITIYLTFRFTNPNLTAVFLAAVCMIELIQAGWGKKGRLLHWLLAAVLVFFVFETQSRNGQLLLLFFLLVFIFWRKPSFPNWIWAGMAVLPLLFAAGYLLLIEAPFVERIFSFLAGEGKGLDSRVRIWRFALGSFGASPLLGAYSQISEGTGASQMHNSHLDVLASYGMPVCILVCALLYRLLRQEGRDRRSFLCRMAFAALLLSGLGEAMLFSGGMGIYLYAGFLRMLASYDFEEPMP